MTIRDYVRRSRLALWTFAAAAVVVVATPWLLSVLGQVMYRQHNFTASYTLWQLAAPITWYDRDIGYTNLGDSAYRQAQYSEAVGAFQTAATTAPQSRQCLVRYNWGRAYYAWAVEDEEHSQYDQAIAHLGQALQVVSDQQCVKNDQIQTLLQEILARAAELAQKTAKKDRQQIITPSQQAAEQQLQDTSTQVQYQLNYHVNQGNDLEQQQKVKGDSADNLAW